MSVRTFYGKKENEPFKEWLRENRENGYYLNVISSSEGKLHAASCDHLWDRRFDGKDCTVKRKVASHSVDSLRAYAAEAGINLGSCDRKICP